MTGPLARCWAFPGPFRLAHFLHRTARIDAPLRREIAIRFEALLTRRLALDELTSFARKRLLPVLGPKDRPNARRGGGRAGHGNRRRP